MIKQDICQLLNTVDRPGITPLLNYMEINGFFTAPCSGQYHLCCEEGLAIHSLNVANMMFKVAFSVSYINHKDPEMCREFEQEKYESIVLCGLLHDLGKMGHHEKPNYVPNMISDKKGGFVQSDKKPFETNKDLLYVPHEIESITIVSRFIRLTEEEEYSILMHNGLYGDMKYAYSGKETALSMITHFADLYCSRVTENVQG